jgi:hypothetical protein
VKDSITIKKEKLKLIKERGCFFDAFYFCFLRGVFWVWMIFDFVVDKWFSQMVRWGLVMLPLWVASLWMLGQKWTFESLM